MSSAGFTEFERAFASSASKGTPRRPRPGPGAARPAATYESTPAGSGPPARCTCSSCSRFSLHARRDSPAGRRALTPPSQKAAPQVGALRPPTTLDRPAVSWSRRMPPRLLIMSDLVVHVHCVLLPTGKVRLLAGRITERYRCITGSALRLREL